MHKNPHQNAGNGIKETLFFKIFLGSMPPEPPGGSRAYSGKFVPLPKFLSPYAYVDNLEQAMRTQLVDGLIANLLQVS